MAFLKSDIVRKSLDNLIHLDTQQQKYCLDLTVSEVHKFTRNGSLDFGGSEFEAAATQKIEAEKQNPGDDYGWWKLKSGTYKAICNESLVTDDTDIAIVTPHKHACQAGLILNTLIITGQKNSDTVDLTFNVPEAGCDIKENARFASIYILSE